ncbi:MAG: cell division protein ZapA [Gammaproteobacteria bacterium]
MSNEIISTTIEILGKYYPIRCPEAEASSLQEAAILLNKKMLEVQESGKAINLERIAIITALNIAHEYLELSQQKTSILGNITQRLTQLQDKIDHVMGNAEPVEMIYTTE